MEKRRKLMKDYEDLRKRKQDEYEAQRRRRIELRNSKTRKNYIRDTFFIIFFNFLDVDTDETEGRGGELEEETVEFFVKEETVFIDE